jgi:hypothetical protein
MPKVVFGELAKGLGRISVGIPAIQASIKFSLASDAASTDTVFEGV